VKKTFLLFTLFCLLLSGGLGGCGSKQEAEKTGGKPGEGQTRSAEGESSQSAAEEDLTAKEVVERLTSSAHQWANDAKPYKLEAGKGGANSPALKEIKSSDWSVWFSSATKKEVHVYSLKNGQPYGYPEAGGGKFSYEVSDWESAWKIDSDEAVKIATEAGLKEITLVKLYTRGSSFVFIPREIPESCQVWWDIGGRDKTGLSQGVYIDGTTGKVLK